MKITCAKKGSINDFISAIDDRIMELEDGVDSSSKVTSGWMSKMKEKGMNLEDLVAEYREETGTDPIFDEKAKRKFRKWAEEKVNSCDTIMSADKDLNTQYIDEVMKDVSDTVDQQVTIDATYEIGRDAINITVSVAGKVFDIEVPFEDLVWDNKDSDIDYIVEGIINVIND